MSAVDGKSRLPYAVNPDLKKERELKTFDFDELANLLSGGSARRHRRKKIVEAIERIPEFNGPDVRFLSRQRRFEEAVRKSCVLLKNLNNLADLLHDHDDLLFLTRNATKGKACLFMDVHHVLFIPVLETQATEEQKKKWLKPALKYEIIGAYAQTEMGHGTNLRCLETTAHYNPVAEEFILHTPTLTSIKWWPGGLGATATHAVVMAQLYSKGVCYGMHPFMLRIRSSNDFKPMPGISLGDIGPKLGYNEGDNGFMRLDYVRIPRKNMLMKNSQVLKDGTYVKPAKRELTYASLTKARCGLLLRSSSTLAQACTIAVRYSAIRRQSEMRPGEPEPQILDYPTQQHKLFTLIASSYAFFFVQKRVLELQSHVEQNMVEGDLTRMQELHSLSSGLKAFVSHITKEGIEVCRMSCGGHGYSMASGLPELFANYAPICTVDGENTVLLLQTARHLMRNAMKGNYYESKASDPVKLRQVDMSNLDHLSSLYAQRAKGLVNYASMKVSDEIKKGMTFVEALNISSIHTIRAANAHCHYVVASMFLEALTSTNLSFSTRNVLFDLCRLYMLDGIAKNSGEFMEENLLDSVQVKHCHHLVLDLLQKIRPNAVSLVDAFEFRDDFMMSVLGRYDGNVYENLLKWAMTSELNKTDVFPGYEKYIRPVLKRNQSKL